jgi:hypothetical protein
MSIVAVSGVCGGCCTNTPKCLMDTKQCQRDVDSALIALPDTVTMTITDVQICTSTTGCPSSLASNIGVPVTLTWDFFGASGPGYYGSFVLADDPYNSGTCLHDTVISVFMICSCGTVFSPSLHSLCVWSIAWNHPTQGAVYNAVTCMNWTCDPLVIPFNCVWDAAPHPPPCDAYPGDFKGGNPPCGFVCAWATCTVTG